MTATTTTTNTNNYSLNHTMVRIKDPKVSIPFYQDNFGMKLVRKSQQTEAKFDLYFLAFDTSKDVLLELTHNYGTEEQQGQVYTDGNSEPQGFGHICFSVDNISAACSALEANGVSFKKKLADGRQKDIAFALAPDGYWIELIGHGKNDPDGVFDKASYHFNHTMIRVKDPKASLQFYQDVLGMQLAAKKSFPEAKFDLYFLSYPQGSDKSIPNEKTLGTANGLVELTHNYGSEDKQGQLYTNGNDTEFNGTKVKQGFGHLCVKVDNLEAACARFEEQGVNWKKRLTDGRMKSIAFVLDPDNYWIEIIG